MIRTLGIFGRTVRRPPNEPMLRIMRAIGMTEMSAVCVRSLPTARRSTPCSLRCSHACVGRAHSSLKVSMPSDRPTSAALIGDVVTGSGTGKSFAPPTSTPNEIQGADRCRRPGHRHASRTARSFGGDYQPVMNLPASRTADDHRRRSSRMIFSCVLHQDSDTAAQFGR